MDYFLQNYGITILLLAFALLIWRKNFKAYSKQEGVQKIMMDRQTEVLEVLKQSYKTLQEISQKLDKDNHANT